jgi:beta-xylosidase
MSLRYQNPVYAGYFADPFVFRHEGVYYAIGTGPVEDEGFVFPMLRSRDFVTWEPLGAAMRRLSPALGTDYWAPEIACEGGIFYLYYSVGVGDKGHQLRVATSLTPSGPYSDAGALLPPGIVPFAIDGSPFQDDDGQWYLYYAVDFMDTEGGRPGTALVVDRLASMTSLVGEPKTVLRARYDWQRYQADRSMYGGTWDWHTLEGPCLMKRVGKYYCLYSGGNWQNATYGVDYVVAEHPMGPFSDLGCDAPRVLKTVPGQVLGPGHNSVVVGPDGRDYIVYHAWDAGGTARRMCIDPLEWTPEGPRCLGPTWTPQTI